jgi:hypothetical protein
MIHRLVHLTLVLSAVIGLAVIGVSGFVAAREWRWNRDRRRRISAMLQRERQNVRTAFGWAEAMVSQLDEIRALPEFVSPRL